MQPERFLRIKNAALAAFPYSLPMVTGFLLLGLLTAYI